MFGNVYSFPVQRLHLKYKTYQQCPTTCMYMFSVEILKISSYPQPFILLLLLSGKVSFVRTYVKSIDDNQISNVFTICIIM